MRTYRSNGKEWLVDIEDRKFSFQEAEQFAHDFGNGFRLPNKNELAELIDRKYKPTINPVNFPDCPPGIFWSSTVWNGNLEYRWDICFASGDSYGHPVTAKNRVRLVRSIV